MPAPVADSVPKAPIAVVAAINTVPDPVPVYQVFVPPATLVKDTKKKDTKSKGEENESKEKEKESKSTALAAIKAEEQKNKKKEKS